MTIGNDPSLQLTPALRNELEALLRELVPEDLSGLPVYLVDRSELADGATDSGYAGIAGHLLDLSLKPHLQAARLWQGRGFCTMLDARGIAHRFPSDRTWRRELESTTVHELAHFLDWWQPAATLPETEAIAHSGAAPTVDHFVNFRQPIVDVPTWYAHGARFHRCLAHLCHRLRRCRRWDLAQRVTGFESYGISPRDAYLRTVAPEFLRTDGQPLRSAQLSETDASRSILDQPPPDAFVDLWCKDSGEQHCQWWA
jgi:hypothetical protein